MDKLAVLEKETCDYLRVYHGTSEFDMSINDISRNKIVAFKEKYGDCYLGNVNYYDGKKPELVKYTGQLVYNFEYAFAIPAYSQELLDMIIERDNAEYTGSRNDMKRIEAIMNKIAELNGINLFWS